jgi:NAD(P)-dependent dehydrogenase (short-subunit alcohol dehydrogenase family)
MPIRTFTAAVALVTGGASGIGKALAKQLVAAGATVVIADRQDDIIDQVVRELGGDTGRVSGVALDVRNAEQAERCVADVFAKHGRLDYLFNNAGTGTGGEILDLTLDDWRYVVDVNLMGVIHFVHAVYPRMVKQGFGHIVNTASAAGLAPVALLVPYTATKHAVVGLSRALRIEGYDYGVRVSALCPGVIDTPLLDNAGRYGKLTVPVDAKTQAEVKRSMRPMNVDVFAGRVLRDVAKNKPLIVHPRYWWLLVHFDRAFPGLSTRLNAHIVRLAKAKLAAQGPAPV